MTLKRKLLLAALSCAPVLVFASPVRVASWNLGWHIAAAEVPNWIEHCSKAYLKNAATARWDLVAKDATGATTGWFIKESRANLEGVDLAIMPPCGAYQDASHNGIAVTEAAYANRMRQLNGVMHSAVRPDVIAFQEVSGTAAVREALGSEAGQYNVCSFDGQFKVQRLAFAWRKTFGDAVEPCKAITAVSLPQESEKDQVRPALTVGLRLGGRTVRFMTVHLKSSCVSALENGKLDDDAQAACATLQKQLRPLEAAAESLAAGGAPYIVLGDFNRNLWHEFHEVEGAEAVRSDGEHQLSKWLPPGVASRNLFKEVFDGEPGGAVSLVPLRCTAAVSNQALCDAAKTRVLSRDETRVLAGVSALGCRNPIGLDHFVIPTSLLSRVAAAEKTSIGALGFSKGPIAGKPEPLLAISDHCPIVMTIDL